MYDKMFELELERRVRELSSRPRGNYVEIVGGRHHLYMAGKLVAVVNGPEALEAARRIMSADPDDWDGQ